MTSASSTGEPDHKTKVKVRAHMHGGGGVKGGVVAWWEL